MMGEAAWARLTEDGKEARRADGPALVADLRSLRGEGAPFDVTALRVPAVFGMGGPSSSPHHRRTVEWLGAHVPGGVVYEIEAAQHGAHLSHPDGFAGLTRLVLKRAEMALPPPGG
jgi:pimeloyl-ACP methyl ester carboxylesterase